MEGVGSDILVEREAAPIVRWILTDGREATSPARFVQALCTRLVEAHVPLWRVTIYAATLHPQIRGFGWRWWRERRVTEEVRIAQGTELTADYLDSPLRGPIEDGTPLRRRLDGTDTGFALLDEFHAEGCTDYLAVPLNRVRQRFPVVAWASDRAGGFDERDLALLEAIRPALAAVIETIVTRRTARGLFSIYHGRHVGDRVFDGQILRGHLEPLSAAIMATDLRDFTGISDRLPGEGVIAVLDDYFEYVALSVHEVGGHILKFIGDGVLAAFGLGDGREGASAGAALAAARAIVQRLAAHNQGGPVALRAGIGLHLGTVLYGNVGSPDRLDFTAIGPGVNLAFRLEGLTKTLKRPVLASAAFAAASAEALQPLGPQPIRGLSGFEEVFGLPEHGGPPSRLGKES